MSESTVGAKGRTTVPAAVRRHAGIQPGTKLVWAVAPDGSILVRAKTRSLVDLAGMLERPEDKHVSVVDMNPCR